MPRLSRAVVLLSLLVPCPAVSSPIYWQLSGEITYNPPNRPGLTYADLDQLLPVGTDVSFLIAIDPAAPDLCGDGPGGPGFYELPAATMSFGGKSYAAGSSWVEVNNVFANCGESGFHDALFRLGFPFGLATLDMAAGPGDTLPTTPPPIIGFWVGSFSPYYNGLWYCSEDFPCTPEFPTVNAFGDINSSAVVPEPSTLVVMLPALSAIVVRRHRRHR